MSSVTQSRTVALYHQAEDLFSRPFHKKTGILTIVLRRIARVSSPAV